MCTSPLNNSTIMFVVSVSADWRDSRRCEHPRLVAHGLLAVRLRHMIVRSLFRRVNKIQNYFDDHCGLYASMMITLNPITKRSCMAITEACGAGRTVTTAAALASA